MTQLTAALAPTTERRLATIETIAEIAPIPDADAIVRARVRGWDIVVKLDEFAIGDPCVYFEVDTLLDVSDPRFAFLAPRGVRTDVEGNVGHVLKTARLRGQYSQGLAIPLELFPELAQYGPGDDVTAALGLIKWDPPIPVNLMGAVRGPLPSWIAKTDEERIQNIPEILSSDVVDWIATEKIDGTSQTFYVDPTGEGGEIRGTATRHWDLLEEPGRTGWTIANQLKIHDRLVAQYPGQRVAVQGEIYGPGIQSNPLGRKQVDFAAFNLLVAGQSIPRGQWPQWLLDIAVPVHGIAFPATVQQALADVEALRSKLNPARAAEGIVWRSQTATLARCANGALLSASWKAISNKYLMKHDR